MKANSVHYSSRPSHPLPPSPSLHVARGARMKHACTMIPSNVFFPGSSEAAGRNSLRPVESFPRPRWAGPPRPVRFGRPGGASALAALAHPDALPCSPCMGPGPCVQLLPPPQLLRGPHGSVSRGACAGGGGLIPAASWQSLSKLSARPSNSPGRAGLCWTPLCFLH